MPATTKPTMRRDQSPKSRPRNRRSGSRINRSIITPASLSAYTKMGRYQTTMHLAVAELQRRLTVERTGGGKREGGWTLHAQVKEIASHHSRPSAQALS